MRRIGVGLLGLGTVGTGVCQALKNNRDVIVKRTETLLEIESILVRNPEKKRLVEEVQDRITTDFEQVLRADIQVVVEAIGGLDPARTYVEKALEAGCHVVTANKELIAKHGAELEWLARRRGVRLLFEASVGGGIPVLGTVQHLLKSNRIHRITGILNGTTNYILTRMEEEEAPFERVLADAQEKGYAEADPAADVEGFDVAYKLAILGRLVFEAEVPVSRIPRRGIREITPEQLRLCRRLGYTIKLLAQGEQYREEGPVSLQVGPALLPLSHPLAPVKGVYNAVHLEADVVQDVTLIGQGAGEQPTASAVVEDLCNLFRMPAAPGLSPSRDSFLLPSDDDGGPRFVYLEAGEPLQISSPAELCRRLQKIGLAVDGAVIHPEDGCRGLGLIFRRWDPSYPPILLAELGLEGVRLSTLPVQDLPFTRELSAAQAGIPG
ncbi:homoserine dehydrogenase [Paludifilum halophilum]|uniref:Homoserine dehydrogenase n=1 Tax=Paludifilum halophilum TaxID=1642702 RepID=A0A235BA41_9BACL|nr:homoserine dehydrogenase [Paludifilum halophilum]OYD09136.1 hypothetical protein CHM34_05060 [Paludifilum halophilum]